MVGVLLWSTISACTSLSGPGANEGLAGERPAGEVFDLYNDSFSLVGELSRLPCLDGVLGKRENDGLLCCGCGEVALSFDTAFVRASSSAS